MITPALTGTEYKKLSVSGEEYRRYLYLYAMWRDGVISNLELQVSFDLLPEVIVPGINWYSYKKADGKTRKGYKQAGLSYSPDFRYQYDGVTVIEEYKAVTRTKAGNYLPRIKIPARNKIKLWMVKHEAQILSGEWFFFISGWNKFEREYTAFDSNSNIIDYPLANHIGE